MKRFLLLSLGLIVLMFVSVCLVGPGIVGALMIGAPALVPVSSMAATARFSQKILPRKIRFSRWLDRLERLVSWAALLITLGFILETLLIGMNRTNPEDFQQIFNATLILTGAAVLVQMGMNVLLFVLSRHSSYGYTIITHVVLCVLTGLSYFYFSSMAAAC
ncbi:MAG: hypothetical protein IJQ31_06240 [Thermoguttaceae bacterium]|nr:hypothetical protein [Thermoguttaceae bacterium]